MKKCVLLFLSLFMFSSLFATDNYINGRNPVTTAVWNGDFATVETYLQRDPIFYCRYEDNSGVRPMFWALQKGDIKMVRLLLKYDCRIFACEREYAHPSMHQYHLPVWLSYEN